MVDSGDNSYSDNGSDGKPCANEDGNDIEEGTRRVSPRESARKKVKYSNSTNTLGTISRRSIPARVELLQKRLYGMDVNVNLSIRVLLAALDMQSKYL